MARPTPTVKLVIGLAAGMLISGTATSLVMKWQDMQCVGHCSDPDPSKHKTFEQPILQSETMFVGEFLCLLASVFLESKYNFFRSSTTPTPVPLVIHEEAPDILREGAPLAPLEPERQLPWSTRLLFAGPATFDILGTTSMNAALLWVPVSVYQMLKGALTLWVAAFSIIFLGRRLTKSQWVSVGLVAAGVAVVGYSHSSGKPSTVESAHPVLGVFIILLAQVFIASQFVVEELVLERHRVEPLVAVGWEGFCGFIIIAATMPFLHLLIGRTEAGRGGFFDVPNAFHELLSGPRIWGPSIVFAISVAFTNFFGLQVTKNVSATSRSTIDTCRTFSIWIVSLALGWEEFKGLQLLGFALLVWGTFVFNEIFSFPRWTGLHDEVKAGHEEERRRAGSASGGESAPLLADAEE